MEAAGGTGGGGVIAVGRISPAQRGVFRRFHPSPWLPEKIFKFFGVTRREHYASLVISTGKPAAFNSLANLSFQPSKASMSV
jgi:hypothetical protein